VDPITPPAVCVACHRPLPATDPDRFACERCQQRASQELNWLPGLYRLLNSAPSAGSPLVGARHAAAGSRPPINLHVVDLTGRRGVLVTLSGWAHDWADQRGEDGPDWPADECGQITGACKYLRFHLDWAARQHPAIDEALHEIADTYRQVHAAATGERGERRVGVTCGCGAVLRVTVSTGGATCAGCGVQRGRAEVLALPLAARAGGVAA
jgi:hypothetical protein